MCIVRRSCETLWPVLPLYHVGSSDVSIAVARLTPGDDKGSSTVPCADATASQAVPLDVVRSLVK